MVVIACNSPHEEDRSVGKSARFYRKLKGSAEMPNLCLVCFSAFISSAALSQHIIGKHSDLQCYECTHCGKKGKQKNNVKTFCSKRHGTVDFEIIKINEKEADSFVQKNSFKGTKKEYDKTIKSTKSDTTSEKKHRKVAKIIKCAKSSSVCNKHKEDCYCDNLTNNHTCSSLCLVESDCVVSSPMSSCDLTGYAVGQQAAVCDAKQISNYGLSEQQSSNDGLSDEQSSDDGLSEDNSHGINFEFVDLKYDFNSTKEIINIQIKIPLLLEEKISNILKSKIINCIHEFELLSSLSKRY